MTQASSEELTARYGANYKWYVTVTVMVGLIAMVASSTIVNVAMPDIMGELGLGQDQAQWLSTAFLAAMTATMLLTNWAVESFGLRGSYVWTLVIFTVGSFLGAFAPNDSLLILARTLQGAAAGVAQPLGMLAIFQVFPPERQGSAMGVYGMGVILAPALGPTVGGMLIDHYSWRFVFLLGPPFCFLGMVLAPLFLPTRSDKKRTRFDWIGFLLLSVAIAAFLTGLSNGQRLGWDAPFVTGAFVIAAVGTVGFVVQEYRSPAPILSLRVFLNVRFVAALIVAFILGVGVFGSTYLVPLFVQTIQGYTPTESGLLLMPAGVALAFVFPLAGRLSDRLPAYILILGGLAMFGVSNILMSDVDTSTPFWTFAGWVALGRMGLGFILPALNGGALKLLPPQLLSHGAGAINFIRQLGGAWGVGLLSLYLEQQTTTYAAAFNSMQTGSAITGQTLNTLTVILQQAGVVGPEAVTQAPNVEAYGFLSRMIAAQANVMGFRESFLFVAVIFFAALIPAWLMRQKR